MNTVLEFGQMVFPASVKLITLDDLVNPTKRELNKWVRSLNKTIKLEKKLSHCSKIIVTDSQKDLNNIIITFELG